MSRRQNGCLNATHAVYTRKRCLNIRERLLQSLAFAQTPRNTLGGNPANRKNKISPRCLGWSPHAEVAAWLPNPQGDQLIVFGWVAKSPGVDRQGHHVATHCIVPARSDILQARLVSPPICLVTSTFRKSGTPSGKKGSTHTNHAQGGSRPVTFPPPPGSPHQP